jgi:purine-nucleoside phosphorylase
MKPQTSSLFDQLNDAAEYLRSHTDFKPKTGLILGTGLGGLVDKIELHKKWDYATIPHFPESTVQGHEGSLLMGHLAGEAVIVLNGRFHYYEGYSAKELTFPTRLLCHLGIERLFISNVAGSVNPQYQAGHVVIVKDHINMQPDNPLRGPNDDRIGIRFPDLTNAYDRKLRELASSTMSKMKMIAHQGVYVGLQGPNLETAAEYKMLRTIGGDLVGMSTVQEVLVANHMRVPVLVTSLVSNECHDVGNLCETTVEQVLEVAKTGGEKMQELWLAMLGSFADENH